MNLIIRVIIAASHARRPGVWHRLQMPLPHPPPPPQLRWAAAHPHPCHAGTEYRHGGLQVACRAHVSYSPAVGLTCTGRTETVLLPIM
eukprot:366431-Chlamydomonas_euryale.AAC.2